MADKLANAVDAGHDQSCLSNSCCFPRFGGLYLAVMFRCSGRVVIG